MLRNAYFCLVKLLHLQMQHGTKYHHWQCTIELNQLQQWQQWRRWRPQQFQSAESIFRWHDQTKVTSNKLKHKNREWPKFKMAKPDIKMHIRMLFFFAITLPQHRTIDVCLLCTQTNFLRRSNNRKCWFNRKLLLWKRIS